MKNHIFTALLVILLAGFGVPFANANTQEDVVGFWTYDLEPGFNLVTFPVLPKTPTLTEVIGTQLGEVEISTWDYRLGNYRYAHYDPQTERWSGNMFLVERGVSYWINVIGIDEAQRLVVKGHPEQYTRFRWSKLGTGWKFFGSTYGSEQSLSELPPELAGDMLVRWNEISDRFELAVAAEQGRWHAPDFHSVQADEGYLAYVSGRSGRQVGPPSQIEAQQERIRDPYEQDPHHGAPALDYEDFIVPPWPLIVGNQDGLAVCYQDGQACGGDYIVNVVRENLQQNQNGDYEPVPEVMNRFEVSDGGIEPGKFKVALTVSNSNDHLNPGDRVYLLVEGPRGSTTRSTSFEVPNGDRFIPDVSFPNPLNAESSDPIAPAEFTIASPYPNPFNDRFSLEFSLPEKDNVSYKMFDLMGREVYSNARPMTAGVHRITVTGNNMAAGLYLFEITAGAHRGLVKVAHVK